MDPDISASIFKITRTTKLARIYFYRRNIPVVKTMGCKCHVLQVQSHIFIYDLVDLNDISNTLKASYDNRSLPFPIPKICASNFNHKKKYICRSIKRRTLEISQPKESLKIFKKCQKLFIYK